MVRGRPRSAEADIAIFETVIVLIRKVGYDGVTMEAIASQAGVSKATVYRRWKAKEFLVADALERIVSRIRIPDTGATSRDLHLAMRDTLKLYADPATRALLSGLIAAMARSERIARALQTGLIAARRESIRVVLARGVQRGDLRAGADLGLAIDVLSGPLLYRALMTGGPVDARMARDLVAVVLRAFAPHPRRSKR